MAGKKTFVAGEVLLAQDVNDYLMDQSVMVFGGTAARSSAIPTPTEGMTSYIGVTGTATIPQIEVYTGSTWQTPYALTQVASVSFTTAASVSIDNVFTSTYANYLIELNVAGSTGASIEMQTATAGTPQSGSVYEYGGNYTTFAATTVVGISSLVTKTTGVIGYLNTTQGAFNIFVNGPQINNLTTWTSVGTGQGLSSIVQGRVGTAFQSDGIKLIPNVGTITGQIRIYGLRNS
jgi:hypothetical protein